MDNAVYHTVNGAGRMRFPQRIPLLNILLLTLLMIMAGVETVWARPVSYPGGWTVMQRNNEDFNLLHMHYSPTIDYSIGYQGAYWRNKELQTHAIQLNNLIKRWNEEHSQANFYLRSGVGTSHDTSGDRSDSTQEHFFTGISMDWETRRWFTQYENSYHSFGDFEDEFSQSAVVGVAPYIGDYGDLHTWLMLRVDYQPDQSEEFTVTPFVRLFKDVYMLEIGVSHDGDAMVNLIIRF